ncbi:ectoine/hydroxyectoine ABC transporter permease subunit EhuD [Allostreptomyces psammosilenae]|uniref:Polar amino acid transport system permease protein n=1 Tax=Allostreptomyces psammosilenae TaxID=1892865 RepID=A0A853A277_9ACTN|nr:ectoine/hydroxyectoine ABC transporter permease subunit EhuD [Allostreptomyces psammosilenae]NYI08217.1 polar amino acid transport system permease protein [Allostreptomyces psammosilenae]
MSWDWDYTRAFLPDLLAGLWTAVQATALGSVLAFALGLVWALLLRSGSRWVTYPVHGAVEFVRNTPLLVQLFFLFYVLPSTGIAFSPLATGIIGLGLHYSTYTAEVYRAGIDAVPRGQWEAATALSLPRTRVWTSVVLPQAIRRVVPPLGNYILSMFKDTPMLSAITVLEMLKRAQEVGAESFRYLEPITVVGVLFVLVAYPTSLALRALERRVAGPVATAR